MGPGGEWLCPDSKPLHNTQTSRWGSSEGGGVQNVVLRIKVMGFARWREWVSDMFSTWKLKLEKLFQLNNATRQLDKHFVSLLQIILGFNNPPSLTLERKTKECFSIEINSEEKTELYWTIFRWLSCVFIIPHWIVIISFYVCLSRFFGYLWVLWRKVLFTGSSLISRTMITFSRFEPKIIGILKKQLIV